MKKKIYSNKNEWSYPVYVMLCTSLNEKKNILKINIKDK